MALYERRSPLYNPVRLVISISITCEVANDFLGQQLIHRPWQDHFGGTGSMVTFWPWDLAQSSVLWYFGLSAGLVS